MAPLWQIAPASAPTVNVDLLSDEVVSNLFDSMVDIQRVELKLVEVLSGNVKPLTEDMVDGELPADKVSKTDLLVIHDVGSASARGDEIGGFTVPL